MLTAVFYSFFADQEGHEVFPPEPPVVEWSGQNGAFHDKHRAFILRRPRNPVTTFADRSLKLECEGNSYAHTRLESSMNVTEDIVEALPGHDRGERTIAGIEDFDAAVRLYWPRIFRFALASLSDRDAAQTVAQDCFLKAYRAREQFRGDASVLTWLMKIAGNLVRDNGRNRRLQFWKRAPCTPLDGEEVREWIPDARIDPERRILVNERVEAVWTAVARLTEVQRSVFLLRCVDELDVPEIARQTGLREGVVKGQLYRALASVRALVGSHHAPGFSERRAVRPHHWPNCSTYVDD
jgi:RNA polymerase sigma-70 factor (ECF subfamily)